MGVVLAVVRLSGEGRAVELRAGDCGTGVGAVDCGGEGCCCSCCEGGGREGREEEEKERTEGGEVAGVHHEGGGLLRGDRLDVCQEKICSIIGTQLTARSPMTAEHQRHVFLTSYKIIFSFS